MRIFDTRSRSEKLDRQNLADHLKWAGSMAFPFQPDALKVDVRGYLYHPSPEAQQSSSRRRRGRADDSEAKVDSIHPYGKYSLLRSELVISQFGKSLELQNDGSGSYEWLGQRYNIGLLQEGEATLGCGWPD